MGTNSVAGTKFGRLTLIQMVGRSGPPKYRERWQCRCDCGALKTVLLESLRSGNTQSCGCLRGRAPRHGHTVAGEKSPTYRAWCAMRQRVGYPGHVHYRYYGGRGITCCERWALFENFLLDMGERPRGMTLDRIDPDGNYEPGNCRWATHREQRRNQRARSTRAETTEVAL